VHDGQAAAVLDDHALDLHVPAERHATDAAATHEDDDEAAGVVDQGALEGGHTALPGLHPQGPDLAPHPHPLTPADVADQQGAGGLLGDRRGLRRDDAHRPSSSTPGWVNTSTRSLPVPTSSAATRAPGVCLPRW